jgi:uncharacterized protein GlcG (DUF336 family)
MTAGLAAALTACSGGGNSGNPVGTAPPPGPSDSGCTGSCVNAGSFLTQAEVGRIMAQAVGEAQGQGVNATIAVVDRVGNPLGVFRMNGAGASVTITSNRGVNGGLENLAIIPSELAAISKAVTGAYLSSEGNAFSTRTASQIVQEHFNPREFGAPSGPLFGVQFSQLTCSDLIQLPVPTLQLVGVAGALTVGPKPAPLGLSADPGGLPLYKAGTVVGGIGVMADGVYGLDANIGDRDRDVDELIATAGTFGFGAPLDRRGDRITADGKTFRFSDVDFADLTRDPSSAAAFGGLAGVGRLIDVPLFFAAAGGLRDGVAFTTAASGYVAENVDYQGLDAFVLVGPDGANRFPPRAGTDGTGALTAAEVREVARQALAVANRARAQIRRPTDSQMRVTVSIVDTNGAILAVARTRDAPIFGTDVSLQKARTAAFFSGAFAASDLAALPDAIYANANGTLSGTRVRFADYTAAMRAFFGISTFLADGQFAFTPRAIGNIARPFFPDGLDGAAHGPLSKPFASWSPFTDGVQLDMVNNAAVSTVASYIQLRDDPTLFGDSARLTQVLQGIPLGNCVGFNIANPTTPAPTTRLRNGIQIFPGASPIYRGDRLIGAIGVSGDGVDQDDMVSFLGVANAGQALNGAIGHAPATRRIDQLVPQGSRLRYVQCPQAPFLNSTEQNVCGGI